MDNRSLTKTVKDSAGSNTSKSKIASCILFKPKNSGSELATRFFEEEKAVASIVTDSQLSNIALAAEYFDDSITELKGLILLEKFFAENNQTTLDWLKAG